MKLFGYGSLMNYDSLKKTLPSAHSFRKAYLYGYVRVFNFASPFRLSEINQKPCAVLNIEKKDSNSYINGIYFEIDDNEYDAFLKREVGYDIIKETVVFDNGDKTEVFTVIKVIDSPTEFLFDSKQQLEYLSICLEGCCNFGDTFKKEFLETTYIGDKSLNEFSWNYLYSLH